MEDRAAARKLEVDSRPGKTDPELERIFIYERDATGYGVALLHETGIHDLDRWLSDWWHADWRFLERFYRSGERLDTRALLRPGEGEVLAPLAIPPFPPTR